MSRRVATTHAPAQAPAVSAWNLAASGRAFRIRHRAAPPFEWELHVQGSPDLVLTLPRGLPWAQGEARPAHAVPPHEAQHAPTWDEGRYRIEAEDDDEVLLMLEGARVLGRYALRRAGPERYALRRVDPASVRPFPDRILPMLAHAGPIPDRPDEYAFELKWDGVRAVAYVENDRLTLRSRNLNNITGQYPELAEITRAFPSRQVVLDGEIVALDEKGRPSFQLLQNRLGVVQRGLAAKRAAEVPVVYIVFDLLYLDGHDVTALPYEERRGLLESLPMEGDCWRLSPSIMGDADTLLAIPGYEGIVAKRLGSAYEPGARSRAWIKIKQQRRQELVIGGWTAGRGARAGRIGALLVGYYEPTRDESKPAKFRYAGSVGTGFSQATLDGLQRLLEPDVRATSPFDTPVDKKGVTFVEPRYVAEFEFTEWTSDGKLRHPSFKGLREDKDPTQVVREET